MKILMVNKFFYIKGGSETYYFALKELLESQGHTVIDFSMKDDKNFSSAYSKYFVDNIDYNAEQGIMNKIKIGLKLIYSFEAKRKIEALIKKEKPDIAHLHIFQHQLSLSILDVLKKYNIPVIYTAHDLQMLCPNYQMLTNSQICEKCKNHKYYNCVQNRCIKDSTVKSLLGSVEGYFNYITRKYDNIDKIITPSKFYEKKFLEFGLNKNRVISLTNFLNKDKPQVGINIYGNYYLYFGRLSQEKGILTLLNAAIGANIKLLIAGTGPMTDQIEALIDKNKANNIMILGFKSGQELIDIVGNAKAVILPSEWYENGPYSAIESLQLSRPIIGSDLGGIPELVEEGKNGYIFKHGDVNDLINKIQEMEKLDEIEYKKHCDHSYKIYLKFYTKETHYPILMSIYKEVLSTYNYEK